jgi:hypothetical protein
LKRRHVLWRTSLVAATGIVLLLTVRRWWNLARDGAGPQFYATVAGSNAPVPPSTDTATDSDRDGLPDVVEDKLAVRYAPIVILAAGERRLPASIDWLLARVPSLPGHGFPDDVRGGSSDPNDWVTYVHVYPRLNGGISLQYWFFYPFNDGPLWFDHEGDWEHVTVDLDHLGAAIDASFAQHSDNNPGVTLVWTAVHKVDEHPLVLSALGSHASYPDQATVRWFDRVSQCTDTIDCKDPIWRTWEVGGGLFNMGERGEGLGRHAAFAYAGRWGSVGYFSLLRPAPRGPMLQRSFASDFKKR